ncbi:hypothetical protein MMA231_00221 [Asticcacaulis sp. MM231]|jgi:hypothetical protein|uniref:hypothetical protein n=1 Tax=Asticcacaulis sp. MM231 TaxID=3157666 RepID=UPI0032D589DC
MKQAGKGAIIVGTLILQALLQGYIAIGYSLAMWDDSGDLVSELVFKHIFFSVILLVVSAVSFFFAKRLSLIFTLVFEAAMCGTTATLARSDYRWINPERPAFAWDNTPLVVVQVFEVLRYACFALIAVILVLWLFGKITKSNVGSRTPRPTS